MSDTLSSLFLLETNSLLKTHDDSVPPTLLPRLRGLDQRLWFGGNQRELFVHQGPAAARQIWESSSEDAPGATGSNFRMRFEFKNDCKR